MPDTVLGACDTAKNKADQTRFSWTLHTGGADRLSTDQCVSGMINGLKKIRWGQVIWNGTCEMFQKDLSELTSQQRHRFIFD